MKTCFKCGQEKDISEFYKHSRMADGHLGKCKECARRDSDNRYKARMLEPVWREKELARQRKKEFTRPKRSPHPRKHPLNPDALIKRAARYKVGNAIRDGRLIKLPCSICGSVKSAAHHDDYSKPFDVVWYCSKHHAERHIQLRQLKEYGEILTPF